MQNIQQAASRTVNAVLSGQNLNVALEAALRTTVLSKQERAAVWAFSFGTLRHLGYLRFALDQLTTRPQKNANLVSLLLVALYQLEYGNDANYAVVDHAVEGVDAIGGKPMKSFVNAVLRNYLRKQREILAAAQLDDGARLSYPLWWISKLRAQLGPMAEKIMELGNLHPPMTLRVNQRLIAPDDYLALLEKNGLSASILDCSAIRLDIPMMVEKLPGFDGGMVSVQDAGAQKSARLLDLKSGQLVVDACAAPGGKTGHILELADVQLTALDQDRKRLGRVRENLNRLGYHAKVKCADAANLDSWWDGKPVDRVLLDAPCSASGVVRRHPDIKWLRREKDIDGFASQQSRLLEALWKVVVVGGKLLYVTCSVFSEENQEQIRGFLARHKDARLVSGNTGDMGDVLLPTVNSDGFFHALVEKI